MNTIPSYIPSNTPPEEVLGMLEAWLPVEVGYSVRAALENVQTSEREAAEEEAYDAGRQDARDDWEAEASNALREALEVLEARDDHAAMGAEAAILKAIEILRAAL